MSNDPNVKIPDLPCAMALRTHPFKCTDTSCGKVHTALEAAHGLIAAAAEVVGQFKDFPSDRNVMSIVGDAESPIVVAFGAEMARVLGRVAEAMGLEYEVLDHKTFKPLPGAILKQAYEQTVKIFETQTGRTKQASGPSLN